jgi:hypothetical protein
MHLFEGLEGYFWLANGHSKKGPMECRANRHYIEGHVWHTPVK